MAVELLTHPLFSDANLVSYWRLQANSNDSKSSNNGTDTSITYSTGNGRFGQGAGFAGSPSGIDLGFDASLSMGTSNFTILAWVKSGSNGVFKGVITSRSGSKGYGISWTSTNKPEYMMGNGVSGNQFEATTAITDTNWHLLSMVRNGNTVTAYLDGAADGSLDFGSALNVSVSTTNHMVMGRYDTSAANYLTGSIDDVAILSRALSATEILNYYNATSGSALMSFMV